MRILAQLKSRLLLNSRDTLRSCQGYKKYLTSWCILIFFSSINSFKKIMHFYPISSILNKCLQTRFNQNYFTCLIDIKYIFHMCEIYHLWNLHGRCFCACAIKCDCHRFYRTFPWNSKQEQCACAIFWSRTPHFLLCTLISFEVIIDHFKVIKNGLFMLALIIFIFSQF